MKITWWIVNYLRSMYSSSHVAFSLGAFIPSQDSEQVWYPGGSHLKYVPIPTPDPDRPYGDQACQDCEGVCCGHYLKLDKVWQRANSGEELGKPQPPSEVILAVYREHKCVPSEAIIQQVARNVLLSSEEVKFWFVHLHQTHENRGKGAQKAAQTRREKSQNQTNRGKRSRKEKEKTKKRKQGKTSRNASDEDDDDENVLCVVCDLHDPFKIQLTRWFLGCSAMGVSPGAILAVQNWKKTMFQIAGSA